MSSAVFHIFKKDALESPIWIDAVRDLNTARCRLNELASVFPGEYFVFDQHTSRIVERLGHHISQLGMWEVC